MPNWVKNVNWQERGKNQKLRRVHTRPSCLQCGGLINSVTILTLAPKRDSAKQKGIFTIDDPLISKFTRFTSRFVGLLGLRVNLDVFQQLKRWRRRGRMADWCGENGLNGKWDLEENATWSENGLNGTSEINCN